MKFELCVCMYSWLACATPSHLINGQMQLLAEVLF